MPFETCDSVLDRRVFGMPHDIDKEKVSPVFAAGGAALDLRHIDMELIKWLQRLEEGAGAVVDREHQTRAVVAGGRRALVAEDEEPGRVRRAILHALL